MIPLYLEDIRQRILKTDIRIKLRLPGDFRDQP